MSAAPNPPARQPAPPPAGEDAGDRRRVWRGRVAVGLVLLAAAVGTALLTSGQDRGWLDPEGVDEQGAGALVAVLTDLGVTVEPVQRLDDAVAAAGPDVTVLVTVPGLLLPDQGARLRGSGADLVLVQPGPEVADWVPGLAPNAGRDEDREPSCADPTAVRAGSVRVGAVLYAADYAELPAGAVGCYPGPDGRSLWVVEQAGATTTVVGTAAPFTNRYLDEDGNAALALGLLGRHERLVWYQPVLEGDGTVGTPVTALLPDWVRPLALALLLAGATAALWRGRRLGPLVPEPIPVVVPAAETVEGRGRLYRRLGARDAAAGALRQTAARRLATPLGVPDPAGTPGSALPDTIAARTGRTSADVAALLFGPPPTDDAALVRLAHDLTALDEEVLHP